MNKDDCNDWKAVLRNYGINVEGEAKVVAVAGLVTGFIREGSFSKDKMENIADFLVKKYDNHRELMSTLGVILGCLFLVDSINDRNDVQKVYDEMIAGFNYPSNCWKQRFIEIRQRVEALQVRQRNMERIKTAASIIFPPIAFSGAAKKLVKGALGMDMRARQVAAVIKDINYHKLNRLLERLTQDKYLDQLLT